MIANGKEKNEADSKSIKLDITKLKTDAGKSMDSQSNNKNWGVVNLNEGAGIGVECCTANKGKHGDNKQSDSNKK